MGLGGGPEHKVRPDFDLEELVSVAAESSDEGDGDGPSDLGLLPDTIHRNCTDVPALVAFLLALLCLVALVCYSASTGQILTDGDLCGTGRHVGQPFLFFCLRNASVEEIERFRTAVQLGNDTGHSRHALELAYPLCVASCPSGDGTGHQCNPAALGPTPDYPTDPFIGMICKPQQRVLSYQLSVWISQTPSISNAARVSSFIRAWHVLAGCVILAVVASYGYIFLLRYCASFLVWTGFCLLSVVPVMAGGLYLYCWHGGQCRRHFLEDTSHDLFMGIVMLSVGACFLCVVLRRGDSVDLAVDCLTASCECVMETSCLRFVPLISFSSRVALFVMQLISTVMLLSAKQGHELGNWHLIAPTPGQQAAMVATALIYGWLHLLVGAIAQFVTAYATEEWYFRHGSDGAPSGGVVARAYWAAIRYHLGTLALGGIVLGLSSPLTSVLGLLESHARTAHTPVGVAIGLACCCCIGCYDHFLAFLDKSAYMDVAMNAKGLCRAARDAFAVTRGEEEAVQILNGVTRVFQIFGLLGIAFLSDAAAMFTLRQGFSDPTRSSYIFNSEQLQITAALLAAFAAIPFLLIFDTVSDTIIYCYSVKKRRAAAGAETSATERGCLMGAISAVSHWGGCTDRHPVDVLPAEAAAPLAAASGSPVVAAKA